jgi:hypothetical protein
MLTTDFHEQPLKTAGDAYPQSKWQGRRYERTEPTGLRDITSARRLDSTVWFL